MAGVALSKSLNTRSAAFGLAAATLMAIGPAVAGDFTQDECKGIAVSASQVVRTVGANTLSREFRKSFMNWMGRDMMCAGPKDIIIVTENDSAAYGTIRSMLLAGSHPLSLQKAGLRVVTQAAEKVSTLPIPQKRSDAGLPGPAVN